MKELSDTNISFELTPSDSDNIRIGEPTTYTVVGIVNDDDYGTAYITKAEYDKHWSNQFKTLEYCNVMETNYTSDGGTRYSLVYAPFTNTNTQKNLLWYIHSNKKFNENSTRVSVSGAYISELDMIDELVQSLSKVFLYVGIVFAAFAILLFSNFISTSISQKKREIGILRAVGARGTDVFKIFFSESFVIAFICSLISIIGTNIVCSALNSSIASELGASIFVFGPFSMLIIIGTALLTAILATFVPVWMAARKKPVESIKSL
jgi:ABC-type antimicrobial peptide transport system permease subunit